MNIPWVTTSMIGLNLGPSGFATIKYPKTVLKQFYDMLSFTILHHSQPTLQCSPSRLVALVVSWICNFPGDLITMGYIPVVAPCDEQNPKNVDYLLDFIFTIESWTNIIHHETMIQHHSPATSTTKHCQQR